MDRSDQQKPIPRSKAWLLRVAIVLGLLVIGLAIFTRHRQPPASAEPSARNVTIQDQAGRTVTMPAPPRRIVAIPMPAASMLIAVDGDSRRLVGMHAQAKEAMNEGLLAQIFPSVSRIATDVVGSGFMPNVEELLETRPDLVFQWGERGDDIVAPLVKLGLPVAVLRYGSEADVEAWLAIMGQATGNEGRVKQMLRWRRSAQTEVADAVRQTPGRRPRTLYFLRYLSGLQVAGSNTYNDFYIGMAGGGNAAAAISGYKTVNAEQVLAWDPEVILLNNFETELDPEDVYNHPLLSTTTAARERRIYKIPLGGYRWDPPSQESPLMWQWLAMVLHPGQVSFPLRARVAEAYRLLYNYEPSSAEIDDILRTSVNRRAANYGVFSR